MIVRRAHLEDVPRIVEMARHFVEQTRYGQLLAPFDGDRMVALAARVLDLGAIFVADVDGQLEGMLAVVALEHPFTGERYADELAWWVEPGHRQTTIGPRLMAALEAWAVTRHLAFVKMVAPAETEVGGYYELQGYEAVETAYFKRLH